MQLLIGFFNAVAPLTGAWIEIVEDTMKKLRKQSLPSRERGLKSKYTLAVDRKFKSLPSRERGLKYTRCSV